MHCKRIKLKNFRCIEDLTLELPVGSSERAGWLVLLGENATGKSSILQAIALAFAGVELGEVQYQQLLFRKARPKRGSVHLDLRAEVPEAPGLLNWVSMELTPEGPHFKNSGGFFWQDYELEDTPPGYIFGIGHIFGFGAARWLPREGSPRSSQDDWSGWKARIANLFDPFVPLLDAVAWLEQLHEGDFRRAEKPLLRLLGRPATDRLRRRRGEVLLDSPGRPRFQPLRQFSDGYQTILAIACEILQVTTAGFGWQDGGPEGLVLLDEIGSHLHPRWKMRIVDGFRNAFPRMQFIATTHDPLCLRGLEQGEVALMRRDEEGRVKSTTDLPSPSGFRVDQLLTSEFFGLHSAVDPKTERLFNEYYSLLALDDPNEQQLENTRRLKEQLQGLRHLGASAREEIMYEVIDELLARNQHRDPKRPQTEIKNDAVGRIRKLWKQRLGV